MNFIYANDNSHAYPGRAACTVSISLLWWNEGSAVQTARSLEEGLKGVSAVPLGVDPRDFDNEIVHICGFTEPQGDLHDPQFGVKVPGITLQRKVEMFQWIERSQTREIEYINENTGETQIQRFQDYAYNTGWDDQLHDQSKFNKPQQIMGHGFNPSYMPVRLLASVLRCDETVAAQTCMFFLSLEDRRLSNLLRFTWASFASVTVYLRKLAGKERPVPLKWVHVSTTYSCINCLCSPCSARAVSLGREYSIPDQVSEGLAVNAAGQIQTPLRRGEEPQVGDVRISFQVVPPAVVSVVAAVRGRDLVSHQTKAGDALEMLEMGEVTAEHMFSNALFWNSAKTWILRGLGWILLFLAFSMVLQPITAVAAAIPLLGWVLSNIVSVGLFLAAILLSSSVCLATVGVAWFWYRPMLTLTLSVR